MSSSHCHSIIVFSGSFVRKMLGTRYRPVGTRKISDCCIMPNKASRYYHFVILTAVSVQIFPLIIFSDSRDPIPKTTFKKTGVFISF